MKLKWIVIIVLLVVVLLFLVMCGEGTKTPAPVCGDSVCDKDELCEADCGDAMMQIRAQDIAHVPPGWSAPAYVEVSDSGWEDSAYISADGSMLYFAYYPGDLIADVSKGNFSDDIDVYMSEKPFIAKTKVTKHFLSEDIWSEVGPMVDGDDYYYNSNRDYLNDQRSDTDIYRNTERLAFNDALGDDREFGNPHYCAAKDELWFDELDTSMWVLYNAKANNFAGIPEPAPAPLQVNGFANFQPFLTPDCGTIYFTTNRGDIPSQGPAIYKSDRDREGAWSTPAPVIWSKIGVGEPTLTQDGNYLFFVQLFKLPDGSFTTDIFYTQKK